MKTSIILSTLLSTLALSAPLTSRAANLQTFTGALAGITATPVTDSSNADRPFEVKGDTFVNLSAAIQRSCDQQFNACANSANGGNKAISVSQCQDQQTQCNANASNAVAAAPVASATVAAAGGAVAVASSAPAVSACPA